MLVTHARTHDAKIYALLLSDEGNEKAIITTHNTIIGEKFDWPGLHENDPNRYMLFHLITFDPPKELEVILDEEFGLHYIGERKRKPEKRIYVID